MEKTKEYTNGEVNVLWKANRCIHSAKCVGGLPEAFKPDDKPWIQLEGIDSEKLMKVVDRCPSGALSYYKNGEEPPKQEPSASGTRKVEIYEPGPMRVHGPIEVIHADGKKEVIDGITGFCRCGHTANAPFCDGTHKTL